MTVGKIQSKGVKGNVLWKVVTREKSEKHQAKSPNVYSQGGMARLWRNQTTIPHSSSHSRVKAPLWPLPTATPFPFFSSFTSSVLSEAPNSQFQECQKIKEQWIDMTFWFMSIWSLLWLQTIITNTFLLRENLLIGKRSHRFKSSLIVFKEMPPIHFTTSHPLHF